MNDDIGTWTLNEHGEWIWSGLPVCAETTVSYDTLSLLERMREEIRVEDDFWAGISRQHQAVCHANGSPCDGGASCSASV